MSEDTHDLPEEAPRFSPKAAEFLGRIGSAAYLSGLRGMGPDIARAAAAREITPNEVDLITHAREAKKAELTAPHMPPANIPEAPPIVERWTPTAILGDTVDTEREPDFRERQAGDYDSRGH